MKPVIYLVALVAIVSLIVVLYPSVEDTVNEDNLPTGEECGLLEPPLRDSCCEEVMKNVPHAMCVGNWQFREDLGVCAYICETYD